MRVIHQTVNGAQSRPESRRGEHTLPARPTEGTDRTGDHRPTVSRHYVGNLGLTARQVLGTRVTDNCTTWFAGMRIHYTHTARTAIQQALMALNLRPGDEILVPAYHCGSELDVLLKAGLTVRLYRVAAGAEIDLADLQRRVTPATRAVYVIHYFGFAQSLRSLAAFCRSRRLRLIEDCALSTYTEVDSQPIGGTGDVAVYNFPKTLPVPDGGALRINNSQLGYRASAARFAPAMTVLKNTARLFKQSFVRSQPEAIATRLSTALSRSARESAIDPVRLSIPESYYFTPAMSHRAMSRISARVLERTDVTEVRRRRRENYSRLLSAIAAIPGVQPLFAQLPVGTCPLCLPVIVQDARRTARALRALSIPAIAWWCGYHRTDLNWEEFPESMHLKDSVLALPVHQQLGTADMDWIGAALANCMTETEGTR